MSDIEAFLEAPGDRDVPVSQVFTEEMFIELEKRMNGVGWDNVRSYWENDFKNRKIIKDFMKVRKWKNCFWALSFLACMSSLLICVLLISFV